jgi:hypothetical protein
LFVVALVLMGGCSGGGGKKSAAAGSASATTSTSKAQSAGGASATTQVPKSDALSLKSFSSPSGNIGCKLDASTARCDVREHAYIPGLKPGDCQQDWGDSLQVSDRGAVGWVCHGDTVIAQGAPVLPYGKISRQGSIVCASADTGVTCTQEGSGHGFLINRERYRIF